MNSTANLYSSSSSMDIAEGPAHDVNKKPEKRKNFVVRALLRHYGDTTCTITAEQFEKEKFLIGQIKFNPIILMPAAVLIQFCCGSLYAWSVFNTPIDEAMSGDPTNAQAPVTFYIAVGMFGVSAASMGPWLERHGPKKALMLSSSLFFLGNLLSSLAIYLKAIWLLYIGYGVIGGFGLGLGYISPVSPLQKWFPNKRGMAAGLAVCGFGAGSIAIGKVILPLIQSVGLSLTFVVLGCCYFTAMMCVALLFRIPPPGYQQNSNSVDSIEKSAQTKPPEIKLTLIESIKSVDFLLLYIMFLANAVFGLVVISRLSNMITQLYGKNANDAATIVSVNGALNLFGRLFFSTISDKIGRKACFLIMLTTQTIVVATFPAYTEHRVYWAFLVCMFALTMCYGGGFGVIPAFLADMFGSSNIGACHGIILTAWSLAGVGGGLTFTAIYNKQITYGWTINDAYPYILNSYWILAFVIAGLIAGIFVRTTLKDRLLPPVKGQWFRFRIFGKIVRVKRISTFPEVEILSSKEYDDEWDKYLQTLNVPANNQVS